MRLTDRLVVVLAISVICCFGQAQTSPAVSNQNAASSASGYTITLAHPSKPFHLDSSMQATMTITNITDGDVFWRAIRSAEKDSWYSGFHFELKKDGKEAETTFFHRKASGRQRPDDPAEVWSGSTILLPKPPGIMFVMTIDLKHLYQITETGEYTLEVSRVAEDEKTFVHSNSVTVKIVP